MPAQREKSVPNSAFLGPSQPAELEQGVSPLGIRVCTCRMGLLLERLMGDAELWAGTLACGLH